MGLADDAYEFSTFKIWFKDRSEKLALEAMQHLGTLMTQLPKEPTEEQTSQMDKHLGALEIMDDIRAKLGMPSLQGKLDKPKSA